MLHSYDRANSHQCVIASGGLWDLDLESGLPQLQESGLSQDRLDLATVQFSYKA
jgi:hypothetical protein